MELLSDLRWLRSVGGLFLLLALPSMIHSDCNFGLNNTDKLILRNNMIVSFMNATLRNFTEYGEKDIASVSNFKLTDYLTNTYLLTAENYLQFVSLGRMLKTNWATATSNAMTNETIPRAVVTIINTNFVTPLHDELQKIASYYSFSYGIFRPPQKQFNFTGISPGTNSTENSTLDLSCSAGSSFLWRLSTYLAYYSSFDNKKGPQFAKIATVVEQAFDQYYRQNTTLNKSFVRASVVDSADKVYNQMTLSKLPTILYSDPLTSGSATTVSFRPESTYTYVINVSYAPSTTTSLPTTTRSTMAIVTTIETSTTTATPPPVTNSNAPPQLNTSTIPPTTTTSSESSTYSHSVQSTWVSTSDNNKDLTTNSVTVSNVSQGPSTSISNSTSFPTISTSLYGQTINSAPTAVFTSTPLPSPTTNESSTSPSISLSTSGVLTPGIESSSETTLTTAGSSVTLTSQMPISNETQFYNYISNTTVAVSNSTVSQPSFQPTENPSIPTTPPTSQKGSIGTQPGISTSKTINGATTFDPDSFFHAEVPVIKKVYNDYFLLRKMGTMQPLTDKAAFWTITLPAAIGLGMVIIGCMLCWQLECLYGTNNSKI